MKKIFAVLLVILLTCSFPAYAESLSYGDLVATILVTVSENTTRDELIERFGTPDIDTDVLLSFVDDEQHIRHGYTLEDGRITLVTVSSGLYAPEYRSASCASFIDAKTKISEVFGEGYGLFYYYDDNESESSSNLASAACAWDIENSGVFLVFAQKNGKYLAIAKIKPFGEKG